MTKPIPLLLLFCTYFSASSTLAQLPQYETSVVAGQNDRAMDLAVDEHGNTYYSGFFQYDYDLDPDSSAGNMETPAYWAGFLSKFNADGELQWNFALKDTIDSNYQENFAFDVKYHEPTGDVFMAGRYRRGINFNPLGAAMVPTNLQLPTSFLARYDSDGNCQWVINLAPESGSGLSFGQQIAFDEMGHVFLSGQFADTIDFDPSPQDAIHVNSQSTGTYIAKYTLDGQYVWHKVFEGATDMEHLQTDAAGNVFAAGSFHFDFDMDPGAGTDMALVVQPFDWNVYVIKLDANGDYHWGYSFGDVLPNMIDEIGEILVDEENNLYVAVHTIGLVDLDPGPGVANTGTQYTNSLVKYSNDGVYQWHQMFLIGQSGRLRGLVQGPHNTVIVGGHFLNNMWYLPDDPGMVAGNGSSDLFLSSFSADGDFIWHGNIGGSNLDYCHDVGANNGHLWIGGYSSGSSDMEVDFNDPSYTIDVGQWEQFFMVHYSDLQVGVNESVRIPELDFLVYPNPTTTAFTVQAREMASSKTTATLTDITGAVVWDEQIQMDETGSYTFETEGLATGTYIVNLEYTDGVATRKVQVLR